MSQPALKRSEYVEFGDREIEHWPGVTVERDLTSRHLRVTLAFNGATRFVIAPATGSDARGPLNHVQDLRKALREIGAERARPTKAEAATRRRPAKARAQYSPLTLPAPEPLRRDPTRDPFAALAGIAFPEPAPISPAPAPPPLWRRIFNRIFGSRQ